MGTPPRPVQVHGALWLSGWAQRVKISIDETKIDANLTGFPVLVYLSDNSGYTFNDVSFIFDELQNDANRKKIAITTDDGTTQCKVEIERWDDANEQAWLWVNIPNITSSGDTDLYLYYDQFQPDNDVYVGDIESIPAMAVWDSNFLAVWHMAGTGTAIKDSTDNNKDGTKKSATEPTEQDGMMGKGQDFDGVNDYITIPTTIKPSGQITVEAWVNLTDIGRHQMIITQSYQFSGSGTQAGYGLPINGATNTHWGQVRTQGHTSGYVTIGAVIPTSWVHVAVKYNGLDNYGYLNGIETINNTTPSGSIVYPAYLFSIGRDPNRNLWYIDAFLDEIRISDVGRSASWVKATYESGRDNLLDFGLGELPLTGPLEFFGAGFNTSTPYVELHWNKSLVDVQFFEVQNSSDGVSWTYLGQSTTANYTDYQVINGTDRYYRVRTCNQTGGVWANSTFSDVNFEKVYFEPTPGAGPPGPGGPGQNVTGAWEYYNLTAISTTVGTHDSGDLNSTLDIDGDTFNVSEVVGAPGFRVSMNWTAVSPDAGCLWVVMNAWYDGNLAHTVNIELYNHTALGWTVLGQVTDGLGLEWFNVSTYGLRVPNDFINGAGEVWGRLNHVSPGNINHDVYIEFLKLQAFIPNGVNATVVTTTAPVTDTTPWIAIGLILAIISMLLIGDKARNR